MTIIRPPWTTQQVTALNRWQQSSYTHEFTCGRDHPLCRILIETPAGWVCPCCDYKQSWAHAAMLAPPPDNPLAALTASQNQQEKDYAPKDPSK